MRIPIFRAIQDFCDGHPIIAFSFAVISLTLTGWFEYRNKAKSSAFIWTWLAAGAFFLCLIVKLMF